MGPSDSTTLALAQERVEVEQRPATYIRMGGDATPEEIDPPEHFYSE